MKEKYGSMMEFLGGSLSICPFCGSTVKILDSTEGRKSTIVKRTKCKHFKRIGINAMTGARLVMFVEK